KKESTLVAIICSQVADNSIIWTDKFRGYCNVNKKYFVQGTVFHKYEIINQLSDVYIKKIKSLNNEVKLEIKE
ncbi:hypothetical protein H311_03119, partial [Anncaliia algerae PRA109]